MLDHMQSVTHYAGMNTTQEKVKVQCNYDL